MEEAKTNPYLLSTSLAPISSASALRVWLRTALEPYLRTLKPAASSQRVDSLILRVLKSATKLEAEDGIKWLLEWACTHHDTVGLCNVLWHYVEWLDCEQSMLFETRADINKELKARVKQHCTKLISMSEAALFEYTIKSDTTGLTTLQYLNLHLVLSESPPNSPFTPVIFAFFLDHLAAFSTHLLSLPACTGAEVKLLSCLQNILSTHTNLLTAESFEAMAALLVNNSAFSQVFTCLTKTEADHEIRIRFASREQSVRASTMLNFALVMLRVGTERNRKTLLHLDLRKLLGIYRPFFDSHKEGVIRLVSISDSCFVSFLQCMVALDKESVGGKLFETQWIALEYLAKVIDKYGEEDWCEMSVDYLLEDASYLEFLVLLLDYVAAAVPRETFVVRFSSVNRFVEALAHRLETYSQKSIFPYNLAPLIHKMKHLLGES